MKIKDYQLVTLLFRFMGLDTGANVNVDAVIPEEWESWFETAEVECHGLSDQEAETLTQGAEEDQLVVKEKAPYAYRLLDAAFDDGPLSELVFTPWSHIHVARRAERVVPPWPGDAASQAEHAASHRDGEEKERKT